MSVSYHLGITDYAIVLASLVISSLIGIGFRFAGDRQKTTNEYLLAGKNSRMFPVVMSSSVTTISGIALLGFPSEVYKYGAQVIVFAISLGIGMLLATYLFIPVYFRCEVSSIYEYLEMRFGKYTRYTISTMFMIQMVLYMSVVLLAPALAISAVTDISTEFAIILCGSVCTFYCFLGGLKAVLWSDVFQSFLMFVCVSAIIVSGINEIGGITEIFKRANTTQRLNIFDITIDITVRYTFWNCFFSGILIGLCFFGMNQIQVQRVLSMSGAEKAQTAMLWTIIPVCGLHIMLTLVGLVLYSAFYLCDPVIMQAETGISTYDQIVPYFIITRLSSIPGLSGICIAGIFSGSLSTMSSALNSMSTVAVIDFLKPYYNTRMSDTTLVFIAKWLSLVFGIICVLLPFAITSIASITHVAAVFLSVVDGPVVAIFLIGFLTRKVSDKSAVLGLLISFIFLCWIVFGSMNGGYTSPILPVETSRCYTTNNTVDIVNATTKTSQDESGDIFYLYKMSFCWNPIFGSIFTICTIFLISFVRDRNRNMIPADSKCLSSIVHYFIKPESRPAVHQQNVNKHVEENSI